MSFVNEEAIMSLTEGMIQAVYNECHLPFPALSFPFPRLTYSEAMKKVGQVLKSANQFFVLF